jgi:HEAT repeat protein
MLLTAIGNQSKERDEVQQSCVLALGQIGDSDKDKIDGEIRDTLKRIAEDGDQQSRNFAMIALGQVGGRVGEGEEADKGIKQVRDDLLTFLTKGKNHIRPWAGLGIGVMERSILDNSQSGFTPSSTSKDALRSTLKDASNPSHTGAYSIAIGIAKDTEAKDLLRDKLKNAPGDEAKGNVAVSLGLIDARDAIKDIQDIVRESKYKPDLLKQAAIGLGLLGDKDLVPELVKMLEEAKGYSSQAAIASALGFIGDSRSIDPLVEMLKRKDITDSARGFAAVALGIVADKETFPWNSKISTNINYRANTTTLTGENATGILDIL